MPSALCMPRHGIGVAFTLVIMALPLLIPWNVVGTIWQIFARTDIGLFGYDLRRHGGGDATIEGATARIDGVAVALTRAYPVLPAGARIELGVRPEFATLRVSS